jgi:hypothetical protein
MMDRAYAKPVSRRQWQIGLFAFALTVIVGVALTAALLLGMANPPYAPHMTEVSSGDLYPRSSELLRASSLKSLAMPITLEVVANAPGTSNNGWGIWYASGASLFIFRIRNDGYVDIHSGWQQFPHILPGENKLTLHITSDNLNEPFFTYQVTFRINDEIALQEVVQPELFEWGIVQPANSNIDWKAIKIYTG